MAAHDDDQCYEDQFGRVLSIQSHVVSGYCGNKSAVFPLQLLGFDVDFINSVQFSTHTGYPKWTGQVLNEQDLMELFDGLKHNNLHANYTHLLTGYARSASFLNAMYLVIKQIKLAANNVLYLCDPVLGDNGKLYVPEELIPVYKEKIIPLADIICPNQFEAEIFSGIKIVDMATALKAIDQLHSFGIKTVVISSTDDNFSGNDGHQIVTIGSSLIPASDGSQQRQLCKIAIPKVEGNYTGTGDLFAALFLAWFTKTKMNLKATLETVTASLHAIIKRTHHHAKRLPGELNLASNKELRIIQSRNDIDNPTVHLRAETITL